jgi:glycosyltransferase involved in cell wall biosynthesis
MMNITLMVLNNFVHDARVHKTAKTLAAAGHGVVVVALWRPGLAEAEPSPAGYRIVRIRLRSLGWRGRLLAPFAKYIEFCWRAWRLAGRSPASVYHANDANTLPAAWLAARRNRARLVYDAHELETGRNFRGNRLAGIYRRLWALPERLLIRRADVVITVSQPIAEDLAGRYGIALPVVVMNCPETASVAANDRLRQELGIPAEDKILLYQGRIGEGRGIETFFDAVQRLPGTVGVALGEGPGLEEFRRDVRIGRWQRVHLPGLIPLIDLPEYTVGADLGMVLIQGICRSYRLTMPNKIFEYLHAGLPVVASDMPGMAWIVRTHDVGELADPDDPEAIAAAVRRLLDNPARFCEVRENARRAITVFNWEREREKLLAVYHGLVSS